MLQTILSYLSLNSLSAPLKLRESFHVYHYSEQTFQVFDTGLGQGERLVHFSAAAV